MAAVYIRVNSTEHSVQAALTLNPVGQKWYSVNLEMIKQEY